MSERREYACTKRLRVSTSDYLLTADRSARPVSPGQASYGNVNRAPERRDRQTQESGLEKGTRVSTGCKSRPSDEKPASDSYDLKVHSNLRCENRKRKLVKLKSRHEIICNKIQ